MTFAIHRARLATPAALTCLLLLFPLHWGTAQPNRDSTFIVLLGTGTPVPDPNSQGPATAIVVGKRIFLVDAGAGVMRQMNAAGLGVRGPEALFITHLHSDHTLGYPDIILTSWVMHRRTPIGVYGPPGVKRMTEALYDAWQEDIDARIQGLERQTSDGYLVRIHEIGSGIVYDSGGVRVTAIPVPHGIWRHAFAYRFDTPDHSIVISGDTAPNDELAAAAQNVDILVHEVYPSSRIAPEKRPGGEDWPGYLRTFHTSDVELGALAAKSRPKLLILHHVVRMGGTDAEMIEAIRRGGYGGRIVVGRDLDRF